MQLQAVAQAILEPTISGSGVMSKTGIENLGEHLLSDVAAVIKEADRVVHAALERQHLSHWHPVSTAPYNQDLELRVIEDGMMATLPFPCRHTNAEEWINVDLGVTLRIKPVEWRAWLQGQSPHPHQSSILGPEGSEIRRREQWGGCHANINPSLDQSEAKREVST